MLTVSAEVVLEDLAPAHPAAMTAARELVVESSEIDGVRVEESHGSAAAGTKGGLTELAYVIASPAGAAALVAAWRHWLQRDRRRSLHVKIDDREGNRVSIEVEGDAISVSSLDEALMAALKASQRKDADPAITIASNENVDETLEQS